MEISIIIIAKNGARYIGDTLDMIFRQRISKKYEVTIIDSGSRDSTLEIARRYPVKILEIPPDEFGHGFTRNQGARAANGEIVVFLNADAAPMDEHWLKSLVDNFENDNKVAGVYSRIYPRPNCNPLHSWEILNEGSGGKKVKHIDDFDSYQRMKPREKRKFLAFQSVSCAINKSLLLKYPFENVEFGEDLEWAKRLLEKGFKIVFEPGSAVLHSHNFYYSFIETFKRYFDDTKFNNSLLGVWPRQKFLLLFGHTAHKILRDVKYIFALPKGIVYKTGWLVYSPIIRTAELFGMIAGANSRYLPRKMQSSFSLVHEIKRGRLTL